MNEDKYRLMNKFRNANIQSKYNYHFPCGVKGCAIILAYNREKADKTDKNYNDFQSDGCKFCEICNQRFYKLELK